MDLSKRGILVIYTGRVKAICSQTA